MAYLLGTQALIDSAKNEHTPIQTWAEIENPDEDEVLVSVISFMVFQAHVDRAKAKVRGSWQTLYNAALTKYRHDNLVAVDLAVALRAARLRALGLKDDGGKPLGDSAILVVATALEQHLQLVDRRRNYHSTLESNHGLLFVDPYV